MSFFDWFRMNDDRHAPRQIEAPAARLEALEPRLMLDGTIEPVVPMEIDYLGASLPSWWYTSYQVTGPAAMTALADTGANVVRAGQRSLDELVANSDIKREDIKFVVGTGYGRYKIEAGDTQVTEISCHARGALILFLRRVGRLVGVLVGYVLALCVHFGHPLWRLPVGYVVSW